MMELCAANPAFARWPESIRPAAETCRGLLPSIPAVRSGGARHRRAPLHRTAGPHHRRAVLLGRRHLRRPLADNELGPLIGTTSHTGDGGASVCSHDLLRLWLTDESWPPQEVAHGPDERRQPPRRSPESAQPGGAASISGVHSPPSDRGPHARRLLRAAAPRRPSGKRSTCRPCRTAPRVAAPGRRRGSRALEAPAVVMRRRRVAHARRPLPANARTGMGARRALPRLDRPRGAAVQLARALQPQPRAQHLANRPPIKGIRNGLRPDI
jgi:hypothetical protein